jgi:hypothetical protein
MAPAAVVLLGVRDGDSRIDEEVILAAFASEGRLDLGSPGRERRAKEKFREKSREGAASIEENPLWTQELVDHGRAGLSLHRLACPLNTSL